jgi:hypothetical protein
LDHCTQELTQWDPASLTPEDFSGLVLRLLHDLRQRIDQTGEPSSVAKQTGLFLLESLSRALRAGRKLSQVPVEHAAILDAAIDKVSGTRAGIYETPDVATLDLQEQTVTDFLREAMRKTRSAGRLTL